MTDSVNCVAFFDPVILDIFFYFARGPHPHAPATPRLRLGALISGDFLLSQFLRRLSSTCGSCSSSSFPAPLPPASFLPSPLPRWVFARGQASPYARPPAWRRR